MKSDSSLTRTNSWVIQSKATGEVLIEVFDIDRHLLDALDVTKYQATPILEYLGNLNKTLREKALAG